MHIYIHIYKVKLKKAFSKYSATNTHIQLHIHHTVPL